MPLFQSSLSCFRITQWCAGAACSEQHVVWVGHYAVWWPLWAGYTLLHFADSALQCSSFSVPHHCYMLALASFSVGVQRAPSQPLYTNKYETQRSSCKVLPLGQQPVKCVSTSAQGCVWPRQLFYRPTCHAITAFANLFYL